MHMKQVSSARLPRTMIITHAVNTSSDSTNRHHQKIKRSWIIRDPSLPLPFCAELFLLFWSLLPSLRCLDCRRIFSLSIRLHSWILPYVSSPSGLLATRYGRSSLSPCKFGPDMSRAFPVFAVKFLKTLPCQQ